MTRWILASRPITTTHTHTINMSVPLQPSADAQFGSKHIAKGVGRLTNHVFVKGEGSWITTDDGTKLLDLTSGIGVTNLGHCPPRVTAAAIEQMSKIVHAQINIGHSESYIGLLKALLPKLALVDPRLDSVFLWNSGAEAVEAAVKLARAATGRQNVIVMQGSYHGRTFMTMGMTRSKTIYGEGFGPHTPGVYATAFPYYAQHGVAPNTSVAKLVSQSLHQLRLTLSQQTAPRDTAAIILEPVLGEGGYVPVPPAFMKGLRDICDKHGILLISDEVQSGVGRTGAWWATQHTGVKPDILIFAKGIANGLPLSGIASRKELTDKQGPGSMGGTYAGNAVACAAAQAVIKTFDEEKILDNVAARSKQLFGFLETLRSTPAGCLIQDVRGQGLMVGVQFSLPSVAKASDLSTKPINGATGEGEDALHEVGPEARPQVSGRVVAACLKRNMLVLATSVFDVIRFIPALTISESELTQACDIFKAALEEVYADVKDL